MFGSACVEHCYAMQHCGGVVPRTLHYSGVCNNDCMQFTCHYMCVMLACFAAALRCFACMHYNIYTHMSTAFA
jgi:hypothetical protein